jgi:hypothetical protein
MEQKMDKEIEVGRRIKCLNFNSTGTVFEKNSYPGMESENPYLHIVWDSGTVSMDVPEYMLHGPVWRILPAVMGKEAINGALNHAAACGEKFEGRDVYGQVALAA